MLVYDIIENIEDDPADIHSNNDGAAELDQGDYLLIWAKSCKVSSINHLAITNQSSGDLHCIKLITCPF